MHKCSTHYAVQMCTTPRKRYVQRLHSVVHSCCCRAFGRAARVNSTAGADVEALLNAGDMQADLQALTAACKSRGMLFMLDVVANHVGESSRPPIPPQSTFMTTHLHVRVVWNSCPATISLYCIKVCLRVQAQYTLSLSCSSLVPG